MPTKPLSPFLKFMISLVASSLEQAGEPELVKLLDKQYQADPVLYESMIRSGHAFVTPLTQLVSKTPTSIDDGFVLAFSDAINESAASHGITF
jgi:hypothetical protein